MTKSKKPEKESKTVEPDAERLEEARKLKDLWESAKNSGRKLTYELIANEMAKLDGNIRSPGSIPHYLTGKNKLNLYSALVFAKELGVEISRFSPRVHEERNNVVRYLMGDPLLQSIFSLAENWDEIKLSALLKRGSEIAPLDRKPR